MSVAKEGQEPAVCGAREWRRLRPVAEAGQEPLRWETAVQETGVP